jgi:hypothetical protein
MNMQSDDMESGTPSASTSMKSSDEGKMDMFGERASLKESVLDGLTAQSRATSMLGDDYFHNIERWQLSVSV